MSPLYSGAKLICRCLKVTETDLLDAVDRGDVRCLNDVVQKTGAGDGCTACRTRLIAYLQENAQAAAGR